MTKKPTLDLDEVLKVAKLAKLVVTDDELVNLQKQLIQIIDLVDKLQTVDTKNISETSQVTGLENIWREDEVDPTRILSQEKALSGTKNHHNGFFVTSNVFE